MQKTMYKLVLERTLSKRPSNSKIISQIEYIISRGVAGARGKTWAAEAPTVEPFERNGQWVYRYEITLRKEAGQVGSEAEFKQWQDIRAMIQQSGSASKFGENPWVVVEDSSKGSVKVPDQVLKNENTANNVREVQPLGKVKTWSDLKVPQELLGDKSDDYISKHPAWKHLYGVNPQIRLILRNIKRAHETNGDSRNHAVLFGHAGCGKTTTMFSLEQMFGKDSVLKLDATSTTKAGLEKLFFSDLSEIPPLVFMEEAEKAEPEALKIWLGALDDRGEIRKVNFRVNQLRSLRILFICTVNNKVLFDKMMGSDGSEAGALSSRCVTQIYYPRPTQDILYQILEKDILEKGGNHDWIKPAVELAAKLGATDPRIVRSYLAGGDGLLDGSYQRDWYAVQKAEENFNEPK